MYRSLTEIHLLLMSPLTSFLCSSVGPMYTLVGTTHSKSVTSMIFTLKLCEFYEVVLFLTFVQRDKSEMKLIIPLFPLLFFVFPIFRTPQQSLPPSTIRHRLCKWLQQVYLTVYPVFNSVHLF